MTLPLPCPVCRAGATLPFMTVAERRYVRCPVCEARFLHPAQRPSRAAERRHYRSHRNTVDDRRYRAFLAKLATPLLARLTVPAEGLDFGCGPGPALAAMLAEAGHRMALYDPFSHPDPTPLQRTYDFVTCTEVAEHLHDPAGTFDRLAALLRPGGWLAVMTSFQTDDERFANWHYRRDPTHVVFYRAQTFAVLAAQRGLDFDSPAKDLAFLRRR